MVYKWNIISEILQREYGYSDRSKIYSRNSSSFNKNVFGSWFLAQQMKATHTVGDKYSNARSLNFNRRGDLLCISYDDNQIAIYDWAHKKLKHCFNSKHTQDPRDVSFININENNLDIISSNSDGQIRRSFITPAGEVISTCLYRFEKAIPKFTDIPSSPYEFVGVTTRGDIFLMDLRCNDTVYSSVANIPNKNGGYLPLYDVAHHPFVPEFCIAGCDAFIRVYDKRNLNDCIQKMCNKNIEHAMEILQCSYNFNGNEILANYVEEGAYLFNSRNYTPGEYLNCYRADCGTFDEAEFFGPKSEFIISAESDGIHIFHKNSNRFMKFDSVYTDTDDDSITYRSTLNLLCGVKSHPLLPVIASKTCKRGVIIWAPKNK